jgi:hypothetical protein
MSRLSKSSIAPRESAVALFFAACVVLASVSPSPSARAVPPAPPAGRAQAREMFSAN